MAGMTVGGGPGYTRDPLHPENWNTPDPYATSTPSTAPGAKTLNPPGNTEAGLSAAQSAVTGLQKAGPGQAASSVYTQGGAGSSYSVDPSGAASYTATPNLIPQETAAQKDINTQQNTAAASLAKQQADAEAALAQEKAGLSQQGFDHRLSAVSGLVGAGSAPVAGPVGFGSLSAQEQAANGAAFGQAKDQAGQVGAAALQQLQAIMSARGFQGSTIENEGMAGILGGAAGNIGSFLRDRVQQQAARQANIADETYQGNITQRGQDLQRQQALLQLINAGPMY